MLGLALSSLRLRKGSAVGSFLALFFAAAIVCACASLLETGIRGPISTERYAGAPVVVTADQQISWTKTKDEDSETKTKTKSKALGERAWLPTSVGDQLAGLPGATVVEDLVFPATVVEHGGAVVANTGRKPSMGHGWSSAALTPYEVVAGSPPQDANDVVVDSALAEQANLEVGDKVVIQSTSDPKNYEIIGLVRPDSVVEQQSAVFFDSAEARRLAGHHGLVAAYGVLGVTTTRVESAVAGAGAVVSAGTDRGQVEFVDAAQARVRLTSMGGAIGGTSLIVALLVVVGTFALSIQQRYREFALLRAVGATPRQVRRMVNREALLLGIAAAIPGALMGIPLAGVIRSQFVSLGAIPDTLQLARSPLPIIAAVALTVAAAVVAARVTAGRVARIRPAEALTEAAVEPRALGPARVFAGMIFTAAAAVVTSLLSVLHTEPAALPVTYLSVLLWMIAVALLGPFLARGAVAPLGVLMRISRVGGFLAALNVRSNSRRVASVVTPIALLIGMTTTILYVPSLLSHEAQEQTREGMRADYLIRSPGPGVPASAAQSLRSAPGVSAVTEIIQTTIWVGQSKRSAQGLTPNQLTQTVDPDVTSGSLTNLELGTIAMSDQAAGDRRIGQTLQVSLGDGTKTRLRLVAIYSRDLGFGDTLLAHDDVAGHVDNPLAQTLLVKGSESAEQLRDHVSAFPGLTVTDRTGYAQAQAERQQTNAEVNLVFMGLIIVFTAIAVINTLAMTITNRTSEIALMRLIGTARRQVLGTLRWELAVILLTAAALGTGAAWVTLTGFSIGMLGSTVPDITLGTYALVLCGAAALGLISTTIPARVVLRQNPAEDIDGTRR